MKKAIKVGMAKMHIREDNNSWQTGSGKKRKPRARERWQGRKTERVDTDEDDSENVEETLDHDEELQAWCW